MFGKKVLLTVLLLQAVIMASAQTSDAVADSVSQHCPILPYPVIAAGTFAVTDGTLARFTARSPRHPAASLTDDQNSTIADIAQFGPMDLPWVMKAVGVKTESSWGKLAVSQAVGFVALTGAVEALKRGVDAPRPDGEDNRSFPSGHTARAFFGATSVLHELANTSPWYPLGAYAFAAGIGAQRVLANRHLPSDVMAGAGIGMLAAEFGYFIGSLMWPSERANSVITDPYNSTYLGVSSALLWPLGHVRTPLAEIDRLPALETAVTIVKPLGGRWFGRVAVALTSQPLMLHAGSVTTYLGCLNSVGAKIGLGYNVYSGHRLAFDIDISGGAMGNLRMKNVERIIESQKVSPVGSFGASLAWALTSGLHCRGEIGVELSGCKYTVHTTAADGTPSTTNTSAANSALYTAIGVCIGL